MQDLIKDLITRYEQVIFDLTDDSSITMEECKDVLRERNMEYGICNCIYFNDLDVKYKDVVEEFKDTYTPLGTFWYKPPMYCQTLVDILLALTYRRDKLKQILKIEENATTNTGTDTGI